MEDEHALCKLKQRRYHVAPPSSLGIQVEADDFMVRMERVLQKCEVELMLESEMAKFCRTDTRRTDTRSTVQVEDDGMELQGSEERDSDCDLEVDPDSDDEEDSLSEGGWRSYDGGASDDTDIGADDANESASEGDCSEDSGGASDVTDSDAENVNADDSASEADSEDAACEEGAMEATPARDTMSGGFQDSRWVAAPLDFAPAWTPAPTRTVPGAAGMSDTRFGWLSLPTPRTHPRVHTPFKGHVTVGGFRHVGGIRIPHDHSFSCSW